MAKHFSLTLLVCFLLIPVALSCADPLIMAAGYMGTTISTTGGGTFEILAVTGGDCTVESIELTVEGSPTGIFLTQVDEAVWTFPMVPIDPPLDPAKIILGLIAKCSDETTATWPELKCFDTFATPTPTATATPEATATPTNTGEPSWTPSHTPTMTNTPTRTPTNTTGPNTPTNTPIPTDTPTYTPTDTPTYTPTAISTLTFTPTPICAQGCKLIPSNLSDNNHFGYAAAINGNWIASGAPFCNSLDDTIVQSGAVYLFQRSLNSWEEMNILFPDDTIDYHYFGYSVAMDGNRLLVGAPGDNETFIGEGAGYIFENAGKGWTQVAKLRPEWSDHSESSGTSVAISGDWAVVGAYYSDRLDPPDSGAAFVYKIQGVDATEYQILFGDNTDTDDYFGYSVAISGELMIIGAVMKSEQSSGPDISCMGWAYIFKYEEADLNWVQIQAIENPDPEANDLFGYAVAIDNNIAAISAPQDNDPVYDSGAVYIYERSPDAKDFNFTFSQKITLSAGEVDASDYLGTSMALHGNYLAVGAIGDDDSDGDGGAVYLYERNSKGWNQVGKFVANDRGAMDLLGEMNGLDMYGDYIVGGAAYDDTVPYTDSGAAWVFGWPLYPQYTPTPLPGTIWETDNIVGTMRLVHRTNSVGFRQGSPSTEACRDGDEDWFYHTLSRDISVMTTEVTRQMWSDLLAVQPSLIADPSDTSASPAMSYPVQRVLWPEVLLFANLLSIEQGYTPCYYKDIYFETPLDASNYSTAPWFCNMNVDGFRLPTEGEVEYFTRAGTIGAFSIDEPNYDATTCDTDSPSPDLTALKSVCVFSANDPGHTEPAGSKNANPWNLRDAHGNVMELCWDAKIAYPLDDVGDYFADPYTSGTTRRSVRGGDWTKNARYARSANRAYNTITFRNNYTGFRLVRTIYSPFIDQLTFIEDIDPGSDDSDPKYLTACGGLIFFSSDDGSGAGRELYKYDPVTETVSMVKDINPSGSSEPDALFSHNDILYFQATDGTNGVELWRSDGSEAGTYMVKDINPSGDSDPDGLTNLNGILHFSATDGTNGVELWRSDGSEAGTYMVKDIDPTGSSYPLYLTVAGDLLFFRANDGTNGSEIWKTDGTTAGTELVKDINVAGNSNPSFLTSYKGKLFFSAYDTVYGRELWRSDGTQGGTNRVKDINTGSSNSSPQYLVVYKNKLIFSAYTATEGRELWISDGTEAGTELLKDIELGVNNGSPTSLAVSGNYLYFRATTTSEGTELWRTSGTASGTKLVKDINNGAPNSNPNWMFDLDGILYFAAYDGTFDLELWRSDGTDGGTYMVRDIHSTGASEPTYLTALDGILYFSAIHDLYGEELFKYQP